MRKKFLTLLIITIFFWIIIILSYLITKDASLSSIILIFYLFSIFGLFVYEKYQTERLIKKIEATLPQFLKNIVNELESGVPISIALKDACFKNYGDVTKYYNEIGKRLEFLPFEKAVSKFEKRFGKSKRVRTTLSIIKELIRSGYGVASSLNTLHNNFILLSEVNRERKVSLNQYLILIYAITFIFMSIVIVMLKILLPIMSQSLGGVQIFRNPCDIATLTEMNICNYFSGITSIFKKNFTPLEGYYFGLFFHICIIQAFFAGLLVGAVVENSIISGLRHSLFLSLIVFSMFGILTKVGIV